MTADERANEAATRRRFLKIAGMGAAGLAMPGAADALPPVAARELLIYVGTYTSGGGEGIYLYRFDLKTGALIHAGTTRGVVNPSYLTLDRRRRFLYAVNEVEEFEGARSGAVSAFAIDQATGGLRFLNQRASKGGATCYVTADNAGRFILVANYVGGNVAVLPVLKDGSLGDAVDVKQDSGSGPNRERQEGPHAHSVVLDRAGRFAYSCDLGTDRVMTYRFDARTGRLTPNAEQPFVALKPGAGPRHIIFHPVGRFVYVMNELDSTVTAFTRDGAKGTLRESETVSTLPANFAGANTGADLHVTPDGRFLFCSNRGHDSIASFRVDASTGGLRPLGHTHTGGKTPRNFAVDPTGRFLLVANQKSDNVVTFRLDPATGSLEPTGQTAAIPSPVCLKLTAPFS
ncbi:MAG: 6-phosphogluconolactonase [Acidobacteriota bacterium]|jgi:6-phosphogluconolactonase|nr:6-phosphogluconolactonase [Acidobacteriota bacterium]